MPQRAHPRSWPVKLVLAGGLFLGCAAVAVPAEVVILRDGFVIQGNVRKEMDVVAGAVIPKASGFDYVDEGPKLVIFSTHHKQLGEISKDVKLRPAYKVYYNPITARRGNHPLPVILGGRTAPPDFDAKWKRTLDVNVPGGFERIEQQITYLDPYTCYVVSTTHNWAQGFRTSEMDPAKVRKYLTHHPELAEPDGKCDPIKRVAIARFMKDVGWLYMAKEELDRLKQDHPGAMATAAQSEVDAFKIEFDKATAELAVNEAEIALNAGRYDYAGRLLEAVPVKTADPKEVLLTTQLMARHKAAVEQFTNARRHLRALIEQVTGTIGQRPAIGLGGGPIAVVWPVTSLPSPGDAALAQAAEAVYGELHPDSAGRVETFVQLADTVEREKAQKRPQSKTPSELLATAVSGWVKGKNGATTQPDLALRLWRAREMVLAYQRTDDMSKRRDMLAAYQKSTNPGLDELTQVISLLPPADPEDLSARSGELVPERAAPKGTYRRKTPGIGEHPAGIEYLVKLPPEYHHGRAYPVLIALTTPAMQAEAMMRALANETDKRGYILLAPEWSGLFGKGWQHRGEDHAYVTAVLRDAIRHFTVDNDRVFLFGAGEGGNMAFDIGLSHPDLFAGVLAMVPTPKWAGMCLEYWPNAQKLPFYVVTGELAGESRAALRHIYERWMPHGFPGLQVIYKGRGLEWYPAEVPVMFDWMSRKKRASPKSTLKLDTLIRYRWRTMRTADNRFFWLGADEIDPRHLVDNTPEGKNVVTAELIGDVRGNNGIAIGCTGVRKVSVWLSNDMIDWTKPVLVSLNGQTARLASDTNKGWRPKVIEPDMEVLMEDYRDRGDRRMLFLAKLEFFSPN